MTRALKALQLKIQALADLGHTEITLPEALYDMLPQTYSKHAPLVIHKAHGTELALVPSGGRLDTLAASVVSSGAGADAADEGGRALPRSGGDA